MMRDDDLQSATIDVEDLTEPTPLPPELAAEVERADDAPEDAAADSRRAGLLARAVASLFRIAGHLGGFGMPDDLKRRIRGVWAIDPKEAAEIAVGLLPFVPDAWLRSRAIASLGAAGGLLLLVISVSQRAEQTRVIRREVIRGTATPSGADAGAPVDAGAGRPRARRGGDNGASAGEPQPVGTPSPPDGFSGAGLGLGPDESG